MIKLGNKSIKGIYIKIGTEIKQLFLKEKKDNKLIDYILYTINKDIEYEFSESSSSDRTNTFTIDNLIDVESISVDNGDVDYKIEGNKLIVTAKNGNARNVYNDKKYAKEVKQTSGESSSNSFSSSMSYNSGGYSGTLSKDGSSYVSSGSYEPSQSKEVKQTSGESSSNSFSSSMSYNSGGYSGTLNKDGSSYVSSGSYEPSQSKEVIDYETSNNIIFPNTIVKDGYTLYKDGDSYIYSGNYTPADSKKVRELNLCEIIIEDGIFIKSQPSEIYYNKDGYKGTIKGVDTDERFDFDKLTNAYIKKTSATGILGTYYEGIVTRESTDTRLYKQKYSTTITKPASDTRKWKQNYKGTVTKSGYDTRKWKQNYKGVVYRGGNDTFYKYKIKIKCKVKK